MIRKRGTPMTTNKLRHVSKPFLPRLEDYVEYLKGIWERGQLTNQGPLVRELESRLCAKLGVADAVAVSNGTLGLHLALKALGVTGEVITTPFSYVATTTSVLWEGGQPVYVDIDEQTLNIDPRLIESAVSPRTEAILATHVYGNPCQIDALKSIAERHQLALIYDAAHAFGVRYGGQSVLRYGDVSMVSLHATKIFHTAEGGLVVANDSALHDRLEWMRRFGHNGPENYHGLGTNAKMSELHAAMGLACLDHGNCERVMRHYQQISQWYDDELAPFFDGPLSKPIIDANVDYNFAYYPIIFQSESNLLAARDRMVRSDIQPRRYFFPALNQIAEFDSACKCPVAERVSRRVLCLPLAFDITREEAVRITSLMTAEG